jgi:cephalosporin-C deacetylase-like acetyl esterase
MQPARRFLLVLAAVALCAGCASAGGSAAPSMPSIAPPSFPDEPVDAAILTAYDSTLPLDLREEDEPRDEGGITVHDVSWASPHGGRATAWLVVPPGEGPFPGVVYLHGSETWRDDFLDEAIAMARGGAISLVVDAPFARMGPNRRYALTAWDDPVEERGMTAQAIVDVRRAYDILAARDDVDPTRLGFVGHSWGASLGVVLAAVDARPSSLVVITGRPSWTGFLRDGQAAWVRAARDDLSAAEWEHYLELMAPLDAMAQVEAVDGQRLYLQYGMEDDVVPPRVARELIQAATGARAEMYEAGHALDDQATADRVAWLVERLGMQPVPADVLETVGLPDE